jgi:hypothetical protein
MGQSLTGKLQEQAAEAAGGSMGSGGFASRVCLVSF